MDPQTSRRQFVKSAAAGAAAMPLLRGLPAKAQSPNETLGVVVIGAGGMGGYAVDNALKERCVAICDIDDKRIGEIMKKIAEKKPDAPAPRVYHDYRRMLDDLDKDIDVALISTPDHHHAPAAMRAIRMDKHVFCQKPLAQNINECYQLAKAAKEAGVKTQMGNQGHCGEALRRACEYLWAGAVGSVTETHTILGRNFGGTGGRPASKPIPEGCHWDEWLGPCEFRDYHDGLHPFSWRSWRTFGTGTIGDMACHNMDCLYFGMRVGDAKQFSVTCLNTNQGSAEMWAQDNIVRYDIPARGDLKPAQLFVYDHKDLRSEVMKEAEKEFELQFREDTLYVGEKGRFWTTGTAGKAFMLPLSKMEEYPAPEKTLPRAHGGPIEDLFWAIKNDGTPASNFADVSGLFTAFVLTGHLAQLAGVGKTVEWDCEKMQCTNLPELNEHVARKYREGWGI